MTRCPRPPESKSRRADGRLCCESPDHVPHTEKECDAVNPQSKFDFPVTLGSIPIPINAKCADPQLKQVRRAGLTACDLARI
jgi:hypothetical protein